MYWDILDSKRRDILPILAGIRLYDFYLAGGTALALQFGHRDSIDFDFFTQSNIDTSKLFEHIKELFGEERVLKNQEEKNTLGIIVDGEIKISFMTYSYEMLQGFVQTDFFKMASVLDIACMKCSAITSRGVMKDYVDLYFILQTLSLSEIVSACSIKFPSIDTNLIIKSLIYFDDIENEPIIYKNNNALNFDVVKAFLEKKVLEIR